MDPNERTASGSPRLSERRVRRLANQVAVDAEAIVAAASAAPGLPSLRAGLVPWSRRWWSLLVGGWVVGVASLAAGWLPAAAAGCVAHVAAVAALLVDGSALE